MVYYLSSTKYFNWKGSGKTSHDIRIVGHVCICFNDNTISLLDRQLYEEFGKIDKMSLNTSLQVAIATIIIVQGKIILAFLEISQGLN